MKDGQVADQVRRGETKRLGAKSLGGKSKGAGKAVRLQIYLSDETAKRLGVHVALSVTDRSAVVEKLLATYLREKGRGRELWEGVNGQADPAGEVIGVAEVA